MASTSNFRRPSKSKDLNPGDDSSRTHPKSKTGRKPVSEVRKQQNRLAQKAYRDRRKKRLEELESLVGTQARTFELEKFPTFDDCLGDSATDDGNQVRDNVESTTETSQVPTALPDSRQFNSIPDTEFNLVDPSNEDSSNFSIWNDPDMLTGWEPVTPRLESTYPTKTYPQFEWPYPLGNDLTARSFPFSTLDPHGPSTLWTNPRFMDISEDSTISADSDRTSPREKAQRPSRPSRPLPLATPKPSSQIAKAQLAQSSPPSNASSAQQAPLDSNFRPSDIRSYFFALPPQTRLHLLLMASSHDISFVDAIVSGLSAFILSSSAPTLPAPFSPYRNTLPITRLSYFASVFTNSSILGFDFALYLSEESVSPLYSPPPQSPLKTTKTPDLPPSLTPTPLQQKVPHHPYIDVLPFPLFRTRALAALSSSPSLLDEDELCVDLMVNEGLVCEGGRPWETGSWVVRGWFGRKWWWLLGNRVGAEARS